jgi:transcriptional regulator with XRE-family HTH domain
MAKRLTPEIEDLGIGRKIRALRNARKLTLRELSERSGLSKPLLSQVENGRVVPPVATLLRIAKALETTISHLFQEEQREVRVSLTRAAERRPVGRRPHQAEDGGAGYAYESLEIHKARKSMQPLLVTFGVEEEGRMRYYSHEGEECVYLVSGRAEFRTAEGSWVLEPGDCLYFESDQPHAFRSLGEEPAKAFVVVYTGTKS